MAVIIVVGAVWLLLVAITLMWMAQARAAGERVDEVMAAKFSRPVGEAAPPTSSEPLPAGTQSDEWGD